MSIWAVICKDLNTDFSKNFLSKFPGQIIYWTRISFCFATTACLQKSPVCLHPSPLILSGFQDLFHGAWPPGFGRGDSDAEVQWSPEHRGAWGGDEANGGVQEPFQIHEKQGTGHTADSPVFNWAEGTEQRNVHASIRNYGLGSQSNAGKQLI